MTETPILDLEKDLPAPRTRWPGIVVGLIAGPITWVFLASVSPLLWVPSVYIAITVHELGHLIAGELVGMPPGGMMIGGFTIRKSGDRWTFRLHWEGLFGGFAVPLPVKGEFRIDRYAWMVAGGPLASLLSTVVLGMVYAGGEWSACLLFWSGFFTAISLLPLSVGANRTDGARLWLLLTQPERSQAWMAALMVQAQDAHGVRPRDWDADLVRQMLAGAPTDNEQPWRQLLASLRCSDEGNDEGSLPHLEKALASSAHCGKALRQALFLSAASTCATVQGDAARARTWRERALRPRKPESTSSTDAAIAMSEGRYEDALRDIAAAVPGSRSARSIPALRAWPESNSIGWSATALPQQISRVSRSVESCRRLVIAVTRCGSSEMADCQSAAACQAAPHRRVGRHAPRVPERWPIRSPACPGARMPQRSTFAK